MTHSQHIIVIKNTLELLSIWNATNENRASVIVSPAKCVGLQKCLQIFGLTNSKAEFCLKSDSRFASEKTNYFVHRISPLKPYHRQMNPESSL